MRSFFVDTWYLIARFDRFDNHYGVAARLASRLDGSVFITHDGVLGEFLAFVAGDGEHNRAATVAFVRYAMRTYTVLPLDRGLFLRAMNLYDDRRDKAYSLVDCASMVVMRSEGIQHILTNDHHFAQEGFTLLNA